MVEKVSRLKDRQTAQHREKKAGKNEKSHSDCEEPNMEQKKI
jgi:hypothetical protein